MSKFGYLGPILMAVTMLFVSPLSADEMTDYDACLIGKNDVKVCNDKYRAVTTSTVNQQMDSVDYVPTDTSFRFAGSGLEVKQTGTPYYVAFGDPTWSGANNCFKTQEMVLKAVFKREDGVQAELPVLDEDGNMTTKMDGPTEACESQVTWGGVTHRKYENPVQVGHSTGGPCGTLNDYAHVYDANYHCTFSDATGTRKIIREDGEVISTESKVCTTYNRYSPVKATYYDQGSDADGSFRGYKRVGFPSSGWSYPAHTNSVKSGCMGAWAWW